MEEFIRLNSQTVGKDKIARLLQYLSRLLWYLVKKKKCSPFKVDKLKSLEYILSTSRKMLRFGKSIEVFYSALKSIHLEDSTINVTLTMSKISDAIFLFTDHIIWIGRLGLATVDTSKWSELSHRFWLYSILLNLWRDIYEIWRIIKSGNHRSIPFKPINKDFCDKCAFVCQRFIFDRKDVFWDTIKNACDVWIPLNSLGYIKFNPGLIGLLGIISSVAGLISLINPEAKLIP